MSMVDFHNSLIDHAHRLASEQGENTEYDRALVELISESMELPEEHRGVIARLVLSDQSPLWKGA